MLVSSNAAFALDTVFPGAPSTGELQLTSTLTKLAGEDTARSVEEFIEPDEPINWILYVPESYTPDRPAGLMVFISPNNSGDIPSRWKSVLDEHNVIWISARGSGNQTIVTRRALFALLAANVASRDYRINKDRVFVSGFSGGSKVAGMVAAEYPHIFKGAIFMGGIIPLEDHPPRKYTVFRHNRFVFISGMDDHARDSTRRVHRQYIDIGVLNSELIEIAGVGHKRPEPRFLESAIVYLDATE